MNKILISIPILLLILPMVLGLSINIPSSNIITLSVSGGETNVTTYRFFLNQGILNINLLRLIVNGEEISF